MARWQPEARERLQKAALALFTEQGFDDTTVAGIAAAAGLTERTFYRHFADKREVLFAGQTDFQGMFLDAIADAPAEVGPLDLVFLAVEAAGGPSGLFTEERRPYSRLRQGVITAHPELQERELLKMSALAVVLAEALHARGVDPVTASLAAESGVTVFRLSFEQWIAEGSTLGFLEIERKNFGVFRAL